MGAKTGRLLQACPHVAASPLEPCGLTPTIRPSWRSHRFSEIPPFGSRAAAIRCGRTLNRGLHRNRRAPAVERHDPDRKSAGA